MRSIWISVVLLVLIIAFCIWNSLYLSQALTAITEAAENIRPENVVIASGNDTSRKEDGTGILQTAALWERYFPYMSLVASYTELNRADEAMQQLLAAERSGSRDDAELAKKWLLDALRRISCLEGISPGAIF